MCTERQILAAAALPVCHNAYLFAYDIMPSLSALSLFPMLFNCVMPGRHRLLSKHACNSHKHVHSLWKQSVCDLARIMHALLVSYLIKKNNEKEQNSFSIFFRVSIAKLEQERY